MPATLVVLASGIAMVVDGSWSFSSLWVVIGLSGFAFIYLYGFGYLQPQVNRLQAMSEGETATGPEARGRSRTSDGGPRRALWTTTGPPEAVRSPGPRARVMLSYRPVGFMPAETTTQRQAERRERTRGKLLDAAYRVFAREGYHGATLDAIAAEAKLSKGALYYNFDSKDDLFFALVEERLASRIGEIGAAGEVARPPDVTPEHWAAQAMETMRLERDWNVLFWEFACFAARQPEKAARLVEQLRSFREVAGARMGAMLAERGIDPPLAPQRAAAIVAAIANGLALDLILEPGEGSEAEARETMAAAMALLWRGMASASDGPADARKAKADGR